MRTLILIFTGLLLISAAPAMADQPSAGALSSQPAMTDEQIRQAIIRESIARYSGNCPCPYNADRAGRRCGARSAHSRPGGASPKCFPSDVSDAEVQRFRQSRRQ